MDRDQYRKQTYAFAKKGDLTLFADVHIPGPGKRPVVLYFHPGGGILGARDTIFDLELFLNLGYIIVSPDYRLAPESKMPDILEDALDAYQWLLLKSNPLFEADLSRVCIAGFSFGAYLAQLLGVTTLTPPPRCILSISGYGELEDAEYLGENSFYRKIQPLQDIGTVLAEVRPAPICQGDGQDRWRLYLMSRQYGKWLSMVYGTESPHDVACFSPRRWMTADYPPVCLVHGKQDGDVPYHQTADTAQKLHALGAANVTVVTLEGGHGIEENEREKAYPKISAFLTEWLGKGEDTL